MKLYLLRHGETAERDTNKYPDDKLRPLSKAGQNKMEEAATAFRKLNLRVKTILSSPLLRAQQTANIIRKQLRLDKDSLILTNQLAPLGDFEQLVEEIRKMDPGEDLLLVGHEPEMSELISLLVSGDRTFSIRLKKGCFCCLSVDELVAGKCATLEWLLNPTQMELR